MRAIVRAALLSAALLATASRASDAPFLWQVHGAQATHYLMGSVHMLPPSAHPLPAALDRAYARTRGLVLETDPGALQAVEVQQRMLAQGLSASGLAQEIPAGLYRRVQQHATRAGLPATLCDRFKAWMCGLTLGLIEFQRAGMRPELGVDQHYYARAMRDARPLAWLESPEQQLDIFATMSTTLGEQFLQSSMDDLAQDALSPQALLRLWRHNDGATLAALVEQTRREFPQIHARVLGDRNRAWMTALQRHLDGARPQLVIVGAAHLVGPDGLVAALAARGYRVQPMGEAPAGPP